MVKEIYIYLRETEEQNDIPLGSDRISLPILKIDIWEDMLDKDHYYYFISEFGSKSSEYVCNYMKKQGYNCSAIEEEFKSSCNKGCAGCSLK